MTDGTTDGRTDRPSYRDPWNLKTINAVTPFYTDLERCFEESALRLFEGEDVDVSAVIAEDEVRLRVGAIRRRPIIHAIRHERQSI